MPRALDSVLVLDLTTRFWAEISAATLGDFGAEVVRIDEPRSARAERPAKSPSWDYLSDLANRNKRSLALDVTVARGRKILAELAAKADAIVTDWPKDRLRAHGLDYETLSAMRPELVYARGSGFGPKGPDADLPALDELAAARAGMMPILPQPGQPPLYAGHGQMYTSVMLAFAVVVALFHRKRTGQGQAVDASLLAGNMYGASLDLQAWLAIGGDRLLAPVSRLDAGNPMSGVLYPTVDGLWVALTMPDTDRWWPQLAEVTGLDPADPRFDSHDKRCGEHRLALIAALDDAIRQQSASHWRGIFTTKQMSADVIEDYEYPARDEAARHNRYVLDLEDASLGATRMLGFPLFMTDTPARLRRIAPRAGQHSAEILSEILGYSEPEIVSLEQSGVIG
jgi:formyl-CoA transferase